MFPLRFQDKPILMFYPHCTRIQSVNTVCCRCQLLKGWIYLIGKNNFINWHARYYLWRISKGRWPKLEMLLELLDSERDNKVTIVYLLYIMCIKIKLRLKPYTTILYYLYRRKPRLFLGVVLGNFVLHEHYRITHNIQIHFKILNIPEQSKASRTKTISRIMSITYRISILIWFSLWSIENSPSV